MKGKKEEGRHSLSILIDLIALKCLGSEGGVIPCDGHRRSCAPQSSRDGEGGAESVCRSGTTARIAFSSEVIQFWVRSGTARNDVVGCFNKLHERGEGGEGYRCGGVWRRRC